MATINPIWKFFERSEDKAKCNTCSRFLSLGSKIPKKQTVVNIKNHLKKKHIDEWTSFQTLSEKKTADPPAGAKKLKQSTLKNVVDKMSHWSDDSPIARRIDKSVMDLILVDMFPFNIVKGTAFQKLNLNDPKAKSQYNLKSEKFFRGLMLETYEQVKQKIKLKMSKTEWISFTTDIWSSRGKTCSLLSFTAHFISDGAKEKVILGAVDLSQDHKAAYIHEKLSEIMKDFDIEDRIHVGVCDNAGNMGAAMRLGNIQYFGCVSHTLQLVIHDAMKRSSLIKKLTEKCRKIVSHFKKSEKALRILKNIQKKCGAVQHTLLQDIHTRWNSTYIMMERLLEQSTSINLYAAENSGISILLSEDLIALLESFYEATLDMSSDQSCASVVIPLVQLLKSKLENSATTLKEFKEDLKNSLEQRFAYLSSETCLITATLLDPIFKDKYLTDHQVQISIAELKNSFTSDDDDCNNNCCSSSILKETTNNMKRQSSLWEIHDNMPTSEIQSKSAFDKEMEDYLLDPLMLRNCNIYGYWKSSPFHILKTAAVKFLSAPPSSGASEQLFSAAGRLYSERRSSLHGVNAEKILFCHFNILNFEY